MAFYRQKPIIIEAIRWTGDNINEVRTFAGNKVIFGPKAAMGRRVKLREITVNIITESSDIVVAEIGDYIVKKVDKSCTPYKVTFYPCNPKYFESMYELINSF